MRRRSDVLSRNRAVHGLADRIEKIDHAIKSKDLARLLGVSVPQMYKLGKTTIPSFRLGTGVRFDPGILGNPRGIPGNRRPSRLVPRKNPPQALSGNGSMD
jgi:hypothetical protein